MRRSRRIPHGSSTILLSAGKPAIPIRRVCVWRRLRQKNGTRYLLITAHAPVSNTPYHILDAAHIYDYFYEYYARQTVLTADQILLETKVPFVLFNNKLSLSAGSDIVLNLPKTLDLSTLLIEIRTGSGSSGADLGRTAFGNGENQPHGY